MTYKVLVAALAASIAASSGGASGTTDQKSSKGHASAGAKRYCIKYTEMTGTRIARQECLTKKEWADEGVQIEEKKSN